ncbi:MAG: zf-HC2 domain-containing protein [Acidiferrobacterales bacterium]
MSKEPSQIECDEAIRMVLEYLDDELEHHDHDSLEAHIRKCRSCYTRVEFEKRLKSLVKGAPPKTAPSELKLKIKKITEQF